MPKFTNETNKAVFVPNPDYNADAPPGSPLAVRQKTRKLLPGESIDNLDAKIAKELTESAIKSRAGKHIKGREGAKAIPRETE